MARMITVPRNESIANTRLSDFQFPSVNLVQFMLNCESFITLYSSMSIVHIHVVQQKPLFQSALALVSAQYT